MMKRLCLSLQASSPRVLYSVEGSNSVCSSNHSESCYKADTGTLGGHSLTGLGPNGNDEEVVLEPASKQS